jgi:hypothetical protein
MTSAKRVTRRSEGSGNSARRDLCGGGRVTGRPTAIPTIPVRPSNRWATMKPLPNLRNYQRARAENSKAEITRENLTLNGTLDSCVDCR